MPEETKLKAKITKLEKEVAKLKKSVKNKKYGLVWMEVPEAFDDDVENKLPLLKEVPDKAILSDDDKPTHILVEGDNYHALTCLNYTHREKIDVVYIDPPYNTGNDGFRYKDKRFIDEFPDGTIVPKDHPFRHSYWLSFMKKRLEIARNLLKPSGLMLISIDDNEAAQLKILCDELFGEKNLLDIFYVQVRYAQKSLNEKDDFQKLMEQVFLYAKNKYHFKPNKPKEEYNLSKFKFKITEKGNGKELNLGGKKVIAFQENEYEITEEANGSLELLKQTWASGSVLKGNTSGKFFHSYLENRKEIDGLKMLYKVYGIGDDGLGFRYFTGPKRKNATKGLFFSGIPSKRRKEIEEQGNSFKEKPIVNYYDYSGDFGNIRHEGGVGFRSGKKPIKLLENLINLNKNKNAIVLDFFAGSGSTGHAIIDLNANDNGNRQFILCTNDEGKICTEICYPRIRNVIRGWNSNKGYGNSLKYYKTDFIGENNILNATDKDKIELAHQAGDLLAIAENTLYKVEENDFWQVYENDERYTAVYFREDLDRFEEFVAMVEKLKWPVVVYIFSWGEDEFIEEFDPIEGVKVKSIPLPILEIYKSIYNLG